MKRTFVRMMLLAVLCAVAGQSWAIRSEIAITKGEITGGTVKIYGGTDAPDINAVEISSAEQNTTVYLVTEADYTHSCLGITWRVERSAPSSQAESRTRTAGYAETIKVEHVSGRIYKFTTPEDGSNVLVNAVFPDKPKAEFSYLDPTDASGPKVKTHVAYILDGTETGLGSDQVDTWYYCPPADDVNSVAGLTYARPIRTFGTVNLILADGCKMTVGSAASPVDDDGIDHFTGDFTIYGQTDGSGTLTIFSNYKALNSYNGPLTINGGTIIANGKEAGVATWDSPLTINGGTIEAAATDDAGILSHNANIAILGGKVSAIGTDRGVYSGNSDITIGWRHPDDYIYAKGYYCGTGNVMTVAGQRFVVSDPKKAQGDEGFDPADTKTEAKFLIGEASGSSATALSGDIYLTDAAADKTIAGKTLRPIAVAETDAQGATTVSPGFLLSVTASGITPAGRTEPDFTLGTTPYYIYKAGDADVTIPVSVPNYGQTGADFTASIDGAADTSLPDAAVSISDGLATAALPWTGANDVVLKSARYYCTGVDYYDWNAATKKLEKQTTSTAAGAVTKVYILTGGDATSLPGGWYVVNNWNTDESNNSGIDALYTNRVTFTGDTHLILADNATMSVGTSQSPSTSGGIYVYPGSLAIYSQSTDTDMGKLNTFIRNDQVGISAINNSADLSIIINGGNITCDVNNNYGIVCSSFDYDSNLTINGGNISCLGTEGNGIKISSSGKDASMTINGGHITVSGDDMLNGIKMTSSAKSSVTINDGVVDINVSDNGIELWSYTDRGGNSTIAIYGGKVDVTSAIGLQAKTYDYNGHLFLGWKNADDYIHVNNFDIWYDVRTVSGQYLMACDAPDGSGSTIGGTLDDAGKNTIKGKYLRPAIYNITVPDNVTLTVTDGATTLNPLTVGSDDAAKPYYAYKPTNIVTASLKNESFVTDFSFKYTDDSDIYLDIIGVGVAHGVEGVKAVAFTMDDIDLKIVNNGLRLPTTGGKYLAFVDNIANVTTDLDDYTILVFDKLKKNPTTGVIEAYFNVVNEVPKDLPVIFAKNPIGGTMTDPIPVAEDNSADANALANVIRADASPLFMTGTAGQTVADVLSAALTDAAGNPLLDSNNLPLSLDAADYVIFLFDADKFVPVAASASSNLTGRRYLLVVDKVTLLQLLNGSASAARTRAASATDGLTAASARADNGSARVWTFPLILGNDATGIIGLPSGPSSSADARTTTSGWFTLDGRRLTTAPKAKGVYIRNGEKIVVR